MEMDRSFLIFILSFLLDRCFGTIHKLQITNDARKYIALSTFGYYQGGILDVHLRDFRATPFNDSDLFGFSLDRTRNDEMKAYLDSHQDICLLEDPINNHHNASLIIYFLFDLKKKIMSLKCSPKFGNTVHLYRNVSEIPSAFSPRQVHEDPCGKLHFDIQTKVVQGHTYFNTSFAMLVASIEEEGSYNLYFHSCQNYKEGHEVTFDFTVEITEQNISSYLSAGEMPLPALYCTMAMLFLLSGMFWVFILKQSRHPVFKIHYLMAVLVFLKSISLAFHGVNYHYIEYQGVHLATWAILFYIANLLKGALLFVTLVLIGTGWTFIKHVLAPRDKRLFMTIIPLQVLANVAEIILAESEKGSREYYTWRYVFVFVDLLCCGCIMFPVIWSIRHLQEASGTDGKAALNLRKLELFKHFYMMILCYIYFTRMIVILMTIAVPFQYIWVNEMFREMATYVFFVLTGYKFRPASQNPYFSINDDDDEDEDLVLTTTGLTEGLQKLTSRNKAHMALNISEISEEESNSLIQKENSHDYD